MDSATSLAIDRIEAVNGHMANAPATEHASTPFASTTAALLGRIGTTGRLNTKCEPIDGTWRR